MRPNVAVRYGLALEVTYNPFEIRTLLRNCAKCSTPESHGATSRPLVVTVSVDANWDSIMLVFVSCAFEAESCGQGHGLLE